MNEAAATLLDTAYHDLPSAADHVRNLTWDGYTAGKHLNQLQALKCVLRLMRIYEVSVISSSTSCREPEIQTDAEGAAELGLRGTLIATDTKHHYSASLGGVRIVWVASR